MGDEGLRCGRPRPKGFVADDTVQAPRLLRAVELVVVVLKQTENNHVEN